MIKTRQEAQNINLKYYLGCSDMIYRNGQEDKYTNLVHAFNTFLNLFSSEYVAGSYWAQDSFLRDDVYETQILFISLVNKSGKMPNKISNFINDIKPSINVKRIATYTYPNQMTYFGGEWKDDGMHPVSFFQELMKLLKHNSYQEYARKEFRKTGLPYVHITSS